MGYNFINPYNFVPLKEKKRCRPESDVDKSRKEINKAYTGYISYSVLTKTPLFIPNTSCDRAFMVSEDDNQKKDKYHKSYDFFSYDPINIEDDEVNDTGIKSAQRDDNAPSNPVIPGSEMRGLLRSTYEILTNSCLSSVDDSDDVVLSRRSPEVFKPGLIERVDNNKFALYEAEDYLLRTLKGENDNRPDKEKYEYGKSNKVYGRKSYIQTAIKEGEEICFESRNNGCGKKIIISIGENCSKKGFVIKGEDGPKMFDKDGVPLKNQKHCCHVFVRRKKIEEVKDLDIVLDAALKCYADNGEHDYHDYKEQWEEFKKGNSKEEFFPVYYSTVEKGYYMLSPASITREVYKTKMRDLIKSHKPCDNKGNLCPACSLFGIVNTRGDIFSVSSKVRVSDLTLKEASGELYEEIVDLRELSSPKLQNVEFYLKRPADDAVFWTYDYYIKSNGEVIPYRPKDGDDVSVELNGRKMYWHNPDFRLNDATISEGEENTERNITVRPVKAGNVFGGKVYFDGISKKELDRLVDILNSFEGDSNHNLKEKEYGLKLGTAKPLGLGSIALNVDEIKLRSVELNDGSIDIVEEDYNEDPCGFLWDEKSWQAFKKIAKFDALKKLMDNEKYVIDYPRLKKPGSGDGGESFEWFVNNHKAWRKKDGKKQENRMPNKREQLFFSQYMKAGEQKLEDVNYDLNPTGMRENSGREKNEIIEATVSNVDTHGNIYLNTSNKIKKNSRVLKRDAKRKQFSESDKIKVRFKEDYEKNGRTFHNYELV